MKNSFKSGLLGKFTRKNIAIIIFCFVFVISLLSYIPQVKSLWNQLFEAVGLNEISTVAENYPLNIHFIDVGKADAILIECEDKFALIDTGTFDKGEKIKTYLKKCGVEKLDYIFLSHPDSDHIGGFSKLVPTFSVDLVLYPEISDEFEINSSEYRAIFDITSRNNIDNRAVQAQEVYLLGNATIEILAPINGYDKINNLSIVMKMEYGGFSSLFCGDIEKEAENDIVFNELDISADLLKVAHHGSKTSSTEDFLEEVSAEYAVISVGPDNNNLPRQEILKRLKSMGVKSYRTDINGTVIFSYNGENIVITTEKG